jgi:class 3 adenylate cyclase
VVLTGTVTHRDNRYYTASGYPVALANRMEALALPRRIYVSGHTAALLNDAFELRDLGAFQVKGADVPVGVFELVLARDGDQVALHTEPPSGMPRPEELALL